ncbi:MAG: copper resistance protein CopC [Lysinibacillus sp.]
MIEEYPAPGSLLEQPPEEVKVTFNSGVEDDFSIKVFDERLKEVTIEKELISADRKGVSVRIPPLAGGNYTVKYYVISSNDGHPVQGSFSFQVAKGSPSQNEETEQGREEPIPIVEEDDTSQEMLPEEEANVLTSSVQPAEWFIYVMRAIYYAGLLLVIGWVFWWRVVQKYGGDIVKKYALWGTSFQMLHLVGLLSMLLIQLTIFSGKGLAFGADFPFDTTFGAGWLFSLFLSLIGLVFLFKNGWFDFVWVIALVVSKSMNGHSLEFEPAMVLVITNGIHLLAAAVWAAGLTFIVIFWRRQGMYVRQFMPQFSKTAFISIIVLSCTGIFTTIMFLPTIDALFSDWGYLLLLKTGLVIAVIVLASIIRMKYKHDKADEAEKLVKLDFCLMLLIIIVASVLTYVNPLS